MTTTLRDDIITLVRQNPGINTTQIIQRLSFKKNISKRIVYNHLVDLADTVFKRTGMGAKGNPYNWFMANVPTETSASPTKQSDAILAYVAQNPNKTSNEITIALYQQYGFPKASIRSRISNLVAENRLICRHTTNSFIYVVTEAGSAPQTDPILGDMLKQHVELVTQLQQALLERDEARRERDGLAAKLVAAEQQQLRPPSRLIDRISTRFKTLAVIFS